MTFEVIDIATDLSQEAFVQSELSSLRMVLFMAALGGGDCERIHSGWLAQPANAASSLAYVVAGVWLLSSVRSPTTRFSASFAAGAAGVSMVAVGLGSFAYHGPQPGWADAAHDASIIALALVAAAEHVRLMTRAGAHNPAALLDAWKPPAPWIGAALLAYWAGRTASPLCRPDSLWQYHAAWHTASALAVGLVLGRSRRDQVVRVRDASPG